MGAAIWRVPIDEQDSIADLAGPDADAHKMDELLTLDGHDSVIKRCAALLCARLVYVHLLCLFS